MIWIEFLKSTCKPKKVQKNPTCKPIKPDHPAAQPTRPPEPINGRLVDGLSVNLFSMDGQRISSKPDPPDPNPPLGQTNNHLSFASIHLSYTYNRKWFVQPTSPSCKAGTLQPSSIKTSIVSPLNKNGLLYPKLSDHIRLSIF